MHVLATCLALALLLPVLNADTAQAASRSDLAAANGSVPVQLEAELGPGGWMSGLDALAERQITALARAGARRYLNQTADLSSNSSSASYAALLAGPKAKRGTDHTRLQPDGASQQQATGPVQPAAEPHVIFKDRQASVPEKTWASIHDVLYASADPWHSHELEPYLYDMDYVMPSEEDEGSHVNGRVSKKSHLWDPELRLSGALHCEEDVPCVAPYLPELYYFGDEYMSGWGLEGFDGEGLRLGVGPNIAPGDNPAFYTYTYIPYTQRILFAPTASLFFPYLVSIYAGDIYVAETDPFLLSVTRAARAGVALDYYYINNYYNFYSFTSTGVASSAVFAATARARGVLGAGLKLRNFNAILATLTRDDYNDRNRILLLNSLAFLGSSGGGYLFSLPNQRNAFVGQNPRTQVPYYAYDYAGASNPFPLQPPVG